MEGARQEALGLHQSKADDVGPKVAPPPDGEPSTSSFPTAAGKHPTVPDRPPEVASAADSEAAGPVDDRSARVQVHGSYKCQNAKHSGRLLVTSLGVRFEPVVAVREQWDIRYEHLHRVEKVSTFADR